ncbi:MAG: hydrogenase 3 maturation endopeptidase HyCI [Thermoplasmata archaeon]
MKNEPGNANILLAVGNPMRGDDGIGPYAAEVLGAMNHPAWKVINAEMVPENFTSVVRKAHPEMLVILDAAYMGLEPGEVRIIPPKNIGVMHFSTHAIPLSVFMEQMAECADEVLLLGIQVDTDNLELGSEISAVAKSWAEDVIRKLVEAGPQSFPSL